jgi:hypothetical protein
MGILERGGKVCASRGSEQQEEGAAVLSATCSVSRRACEVTAITAVLAPWGVLMAADGRVTLNDAVRATASAALLSEETESAQKLFPIGDSNRAIVYGLGGAIMSGDLAFDMRKEFQRQAPVLATQEFRSPSEYVDALGQSVAAAITRAQWFPESGGKSERGWKIAEAIFGGCFGSLVCLIVAEFFHSNDIAHVHITQYLEGVTTQLRYGPQAITDQMYDHRGNPVPNSPLAQYVCALGSNPTVSEARRSAVGYIEACCSPAGRQLDPKGCRSIGGHIHAATVKPRAGFQWVIPPKKGEG